MIANSLAVGTGGAEENRLLRPAAGADDAAELEDSERVHCGSGGCRWRAGGDEPA